MIPLAAVAAGGQLAGGLLGGKARSDAAKKALQQTRIVTDEAVRGVEQDNVQLAALRADDEARLKAATGYDLKKLRDQAIGAGFNPLTVLQATGGVGYDGRGAVLQTPFESRADAFMQRAQLVSAAAQGVASTAGYVGDALASAASAFVGQVNSDRQLTADYYRINTQYAADMAMSKAMAGNGPFGGSVTSGTNGPVASTGDLREAWADPILPDWLNRAIYGDPEVKRIKNASVMENMGFFHGVADEIVSFFEDTAPDPNSVWSSPYNLGKAAREWIGSGAPPAHQRGDMGKSDVSVMSPWTSFANWARGYELPN